jgi:hypothetical protein
LAQLRQTVYASCAGEADQAPNALALPIAVEVVGVFDAPGVIDPLPHVSTVIHGNMWRAARRAPMPSRLRCQTGAQIGKPVRSEQA